MNKWACKFYKHVHVRIEKKRDEWLLYIGQKTVGEGRAFLS